MTSSIALGRALVSRYAIGQKPNSGALILGLTLSLASLIAAFSVIGLLRVLLPEPILGPSAAASIGDLPTFALYARGVLIGPFVELWAQVIPIELFRRFGASSRACIIFSALTFGCTLSERRVAAWRIDICFRPCVCLRVCPLPTLWMATLLLGRIFRPRVT